MTRAGFLVAFLLIAAGIVQSESEDLRAKGRSLYSSLCERCHGENGDATGYPGIIPLSGITSRIPNDQIATLSAPFVGRTFKGKEAEALIAHLETLKGEKGFDQPGYLFSPSLLERKLGETRHYRVVDSRPAKDYSARHIPNSVAWDQNPPKGKTRERLGQLGIGPETFVVVYDGQGGPAAAAVWWVLLQAGHRRAAVLDGGFEAWTRQSYPVTNAPSSFTPVPYPADSGPTTGTLPRGCEELEEKILLHGRADATRQTRFDWRKTRDENGVLPASDVRAYLESIEIGPSHRYVLRGGEQENAYLVLLLNLLGQHPYVSPAGDSLCLPPESKTEALYLPDPVSGLAVAHPQTRARRPR